MSWVVVHGTARRCNQSIQKEISVEYSLEGLMLKLKLQYSGHLMRKTDSFEKTLMLGKIESRRRRWQRMRFWMLSSTQWTWVWVNSRRWWWTGKPDVLQSMGSQRVGHDWATELNWTPRTRTAVLLHSVGMMLKARKEKKHLLDSLQPPWLELLSHPWEPEQAWFPLLDWGGMETAW